MRTVHYTIATPPNCVGAIACLQLRASDSPAMDAFLAAAALDTPRAVPLGKPVLRDFFGIDEGLAIRWDATTLDLFPHGGIAIVRALAARLESLGAAPSGTLVYPEAADAIEQRMLEALAHSRSPLAIDRLLAEPSRWRAHKPGAPLADSAALGRLLDPPLVAAVGPANIGKSTLLNALAGRSVSIVADMPGTTRDHVGATLELGGLVVRYLDAPGWRSDPDAPVEPAHPARPDRPDRRDGTAGIDAEAAAIANAAIASADLLLVCGDPASPAGTDDAPPGPAVRRSVCLRRDLGEPCWSPDAAVSVHEGTGMTELVRTIRDALLPPEALADPRPWRFWVSANAAGGASEALEP